MKKLFSMLVGIVLAMSLVLSFAACGGSGSGSATDVPPAVDEGEDLATETVEGFMDAFCDMRLADMVDYIDEDTDTDDLPFEDTDDLYDLFMEAAVEGVGMEGIEDYMDPIADTIISALTDSMDYNISDVEEDGDNYVFTVDVEFMDFGALEDFETLMGDEDMDAISEEIAMELLESGDVTEDMTEEEIIDALMGPVFERMNEIIADNIENIDTLETSIELVVYEDNGDWVISNDDSDISDLMSAVE